MENNKSGKIPFISRAQLVLSVAICPAFIVLFALLINVLEIAPYIIAVVLSALYLMDKLSVSYTSMPLKQSPKYAPNL